MITLSVIGVVAALTIPTLARKYEEHVAAVKAKKAYSQVAQAWLMYVNDNGGTAVDSFTNSSNLSDKFLLSGKYFPISRKKAGSSDQNHRVYYLNKDDKSYGYRGILTTSGVFIGIINSQASSDCTTRGYQGFCAEALIDINGEKGPNKVGFDSFFISLMSDKISPRHPSNNPHHALYNTTCLRPENPGSGGWANTGYGCLNRIFQGLPTFQD